jgi:hypothetical protein
MTVLRRRSLTLAALVFAVAATAANALRGDEPLPPSDGPLGETPAQIIQRYGPVRRHHARVRHHQVLEGGTDMDGDLHEKNGIIVRVVYHQGHADLLEFNREAGALSPADVDLLLAATAGGFAWEQGKGSNDAMKMYRRTDNRAIAHWTTDADGSLLIATEDATSFNDKLLP